VRESLLCVTTLLLLQRYDGFAATAVTDEDRHRTALYRAEQERSHAQERFADLDAFLASLALRVNIGPPTKAELTRVAQLTQRTNQFNLTTVRYQLGEIEAIAASGAHLVLAMTVADRYGEYGLTGV